MLDEDRENHMKNYRDEIKKYSTSFVEMEIGEIIMRELNKYAVHREEMNQALSSTDLEELGVYLLEEAERHYKKLFAKLREYEKDT